MIRQDALLSPCSPTAIGLLYSRLMYSLHNSRVVSGKQHMCCKWQSPKCMPDAWSACHLPSVTHQMSLTCWSECLKRHWNRLSYC